MQTGQIIPSRDKAIDPVEVKNAVGVVSYTSIRDIAQKIGIYPSKENLDEIFRICRESEQTHTQAGSLSSIKPSSKDAYPYFRWA